MTNIVESLKRREYRSISEGLALGKKGCFLSSSRQEEDDDMGT